MELSETKYGLTVVFMFSLGIALGSFYVTRYPLEGDYFLSIVFLVIGVILGIASRVIK